MAKRYQVRMYRRHNPTGGYASLWYKVIDTIERKTIRTGIVTNAEANKIADELNKKR